MLLKNIASMSALSLYRGLVQMGVNIALAAFVSPAEYGLVVFTLPFVLFLSMMTDMGLSSAMIRKPDLSLEQAGAALTLMLAVGGALTLVMALGSIPLTGLTHMAGLSEVMVAMSVSVVLTVGATAPRAVLERQLRYGLIAIIEAVAVFVAAISAVVIVRLGGGVWALVAYNVLMNAVRMVAFTVFGRRGFVINFQWAELVPLLSFGGWVLANNVLNFFARNAANFLIGGALGAAAVGLYGLANQFMLIPMIVITWPASGVMLSTLSREGLGSSRSNAMVSSVLMATAMISFPAMIYLTFGMHYPSGEFLSSKWQGVEDILRWLAPVGALQSIAAYNGAVLLVANRAKSQFMYSLLNTAVTVIVIAVALPFGIKFVAIAYAGIGLVMCIVFLSLIAKLTIGWMGIIKATAPATVASLVGLGVALMLESRTHDSLLHWIMATIAYGLTVVAIYALYRKDIFRAVDHMRSKRLITESVD